jgi:hypothetical protein
MARWRSELLPWILAARIVSAGAIARAYDDSEHSTVAEKAIVDLCTLLHQAPLSGVELDLAKLLCPPAPRSLVESEECAHCSFVWIASSVEKLHDDPNELFLRERPRESESFASFRHYHPQSLREYGRWHDTALQLAIYASAQAAGTDARGQLLRQAMVFEAFAVHYLADQFSPGKGVLPRADVHAGVRLRNERRSNRGRPDKAGKVFFGDGFLKSDRQQEQEMVTQTLGSLRQFFPSFAPGAKMSLGDTPALPFFAWDHVEENDIWSHRLSEWLEMALLFGEPGSAPVPGGRLSVNLFRYARLFSELEPETYQVVAPPADSGAGFRILPIHRRLRAVGGLGLRIPAFHVDEKRSADVDVVVESSFSCWFSEPRCARRPNLSAGFDAYVPLRGDGVSLYLGVRVGYVHRLSTPITRRSYLLAGLAY